MDGLVFHFSSFLSFSFTSSTDSRCLGGDCRAPAEALLRWSVQKLLCTPYDRRAIPGLGFLTCIARPSFECMIRHAGRGICRWCFQRMGLGIQPHGIVLIISCEWLSRPMIVSLCPWVQISKGKEGGSRIKRDRPMLSNMGET